MHSDERSEKQPNNFDGQPVIIYLFIYFLFFLKIYTINVFARSNTMIVSKLEEKNLMN